MATFVIVGASLAGVRAAAGLRAGGFDGHVVLVTDEPHLPYDRPPLSKGLLMGTSSAAEILLEKEDFYVENAIELRLGAKVARLLPSERRVVLADGRELGADKVLLCTGGHPRRLGVPGCDLPGVHYLRTLDDALAVRDRLTRGGPVVVVGAGFIGAEVAASARGLGLPVALLEIAPVPLSRVLGEQIGRLYADLHRDRGVDLRTGVGVARIDGTDRVEQVVTTDGRALPADLVVVGIGIEPTTWLAEDAGVAVGNGVLVNEYGETSVDGVFAAGDVASRLDPRTGRRVRHEHWQTAQRHGAATAATMLGERKPFTAVPWFWSDQYDVTLQLAGHPMPGDELVIRGDVGESTFTAFYLRGGRLSGALGLNRPRDVRAAMNLIEHAVPVEASALSDPGVDLRKLSKAGRAA